MTKPMALPCAPQPKQWKNCLAWLTVNEGVFSEWNGQQATWFAPAFLSGT